MKRFRNEADEQPIDTEVLDALLTATTPVEPPRALRAIVLERIGRQADSKFITLPGAQGWKELIPGIEVKRLCVDEQAGTKSFLLRARAGMSLPGHDHHGFEECMVIDGEFSMGDITLRAGDYHAAVTGTMHPAASTRTGVTVYLRAAISDYPGV
ncbi:MAG: anti-ECFsigma factor ChrR [Gammaproteobacteria bacterium]|nr:MAG: anti-ECFsigma factor ChrR [Gammaproteobacteria bacterium]TND07127.1 MAG: anti-ECFsigma factor ChrR [Gammaproteobacteria bacterium]